MGELEGEYGERADFVVVPAEETLQRADEIEAFGFTELRHGLVIFDAAGEVAARLPGHDYGRPEIEAALLGVLGAG